jgi:SAM-dependent methyltransferase
VKRTARLALRNREAIAAALDEVLPVEGTVLELGSGTGEHAVFLARRFPGLAWQPSDPDPEARASIAAWSAEARLPNLRPPLAYDLRTPLWHGHAVEAVLCVNVLHVAPPGCGAALVRGAARVLPPGGPLAVYGPFTRGAPPRTGRLARFDAELRAADPALGVRDAGELTAAARDTGLALDAELAMPEEGDLLLVFRRVP